MADSTETAARMQSIEPFHVMDLLARARTLEAAGRSIIHMEVGEPDFVTPPAIIEAGINALKQGHTHYTPAVGLPELRAAIAHFYQEHHAVEISPRRIVITPGASGALQLILGILVNPGERVLMADPGYPCNRHFVRLFEGEPVSIPVDAGTGYQLTADLVDRYWSEHTRSVMCASPSNPTGTVLDSGELGAIADVVARHRGRLIVDEIYHGLVYDTAIPSVLELGDEAFVINSFSKYFGMTGWRLGWLVAPADFIEAIDRLAQNIFLAASTPAQYAALAAFLPDSRIVLEQRREAFRQRRDFLLPALRQLGFDIPVIPQGAFYLYADCSRFTEDSFHFCHELLDKAGVAITPGCDFGHFQAARHVRFAYTTSMENLQEGVDRLQRYLAGI